MPRKRQIDPAFFSDETMVELPIEAAYLYIGLWCWADDCYNIEGSASQWRMWIFPERGYTTDQVKGWQDFLVKARRIFPYGVDGKDYYHVPNLKKHQVIQHKSAARCPSPPDGLLNEVAMSTTGGLNESSHRVEENGVELNGVEQSGSGEPPTASDGDKEIIDIWKSVKGFKMPSVKACVELVNKIKSEFPRVDILAESKTWAARKLSEPLKADSKPSQQIWNWMKKAEEFRAKGGSHGEGRGHRQTPQRLPTTEELKASLGKPLD